jgi:hypothetical protein
MMPQRTITVRKPNGLVAERRDGFDTRKFWYDGKTAILHDERKKVYSTIEAPETIDALLEFLRDEYGLTLPLADFFRADFVATVEPLLTIARYDGWEEIVGHRCHRLVLETAEVKGLVWIDADPKAPLLRRVKLLYHAYPGQPDYTATISEWDLTTKVGEGAFAFRPPKDAKEIAMVPNLPSGPGAKGE